MNAPEQTVSLAGIGSKTAGSTIAISAVSSNTALIPNPTVTYTSPQATGTLKFTPAAGQEGTATITVTLSATGEESNTYSFDVVVKRDVSIDNAEQGVFIYPNPATDVINFNASFEGEGWSYSIASTTGATLRSGAIAAGSTSLQVNVSDLIPGWYLLQITNGKETESQLFQKK